MTNLAEIGPHNWQDFSDFWREADAEWLQARTTLRVDTHALLPTTVPSPGVGQVVYVRDVAGFQHDVLFMYASDSKGDKSFIPGWKPYPALPRYLYASEDSDQRVTFGHHQGNPATTTIPSVSLSPTGLTVVSDLVVRGTGGSADIFKITKDDVRITTGVGNKTVVFTTNAAGLVSNFPITAPGFISTGGAVTMAGAVSVGSLTATGTVKANTITVDTTLTATGAADASQFTAKGAGTAGGFKAAGGQFYGDANGAVIQRIAGGPQIYVNTAVEIKGGTNTDVDNQLRVLTGRPIEYRNTANNATLGYSGPVIVSATSLSAPTAPSGSSRRGQHAHPQSQEPHWNFHPGLP